MKSKKDEVIKTLFKKRNQKMQSMETPKEALSHHVSASGLESFNYQHHHNFSQIDNPKGSILSNSSTDPNNQSNSLSKVLKDKKYKKMIAERTHTPPPPTSVGRITQTQNSNEKTLHTSASFISKKQTAYVNPKNPDDNYAVGPQPS